MCCRCPESWLEHAIYLGAEGKCNENRCLNFTSIKNLNVKIRGRHGCEEGPLRAFDWLSILNNWSRVLTVTVPWRRVVGLQRLHLQGRLKTVCCRFWYGTYLTLVLNIVFINLDPSVLNTLNAWCVHPSWQHFKRIRPRYNRCKLLLHTRPPICETADAINQDWQIFRYPFELVHRIIMNDTSACQWISRLNIIVECYRSQSSLDFLPKMDIISEARKPPHSWASAAWRLLSSSGSRFVI